ncbi:MAG: hypothetical protein IJC26_08045, partial [Clostridia bacterium]|nr:hypothetical protein [Clostridia bacterium]
MAEETFVQIERTKLGDWNTAEATCRVEAEIVLPEYKEEAERIVRTIPKAVIKNKQIYLRDRHLICEIEGTVGFHILYQTPTGGEKGKVSSFLHSESFFHSFKLPCGSEELSADEIAVFSEVTPRSSTLKLHGPRKMGAKCEIAILLDIKCNRSFSAYPANSSADLITKGTEVSMTRLHTKHTEEMSFSQTISLPKAYLPIDEVCEMEAVLFAQNVKAEDGGVSFLGLCDLHCSYTAAGENEFISFYQPIEFERHLAVSELSAEHLCRVEMTPVALKATSDINEDGENKNILFELDFLCEVNAYETEHVPVAQDVFSTGKQVIAEKKRELVQELLGSFDFSDTLKGIVPSANSSLSRAEGIYGGVEFRNSYLEEGRLCLEGKLSFSYLGIADDGEVKAYEDTYDFKTHVQPPFSIPEEEESTVEVYGVARGIDIEPDGEQLRLRFDLCGSVYVFVKHRPELVCGIELGEDLELRRGEIL